MLTGFGRTGKMFAIEHEQVVPDVLTVGKGFGGGFPMSGLIIREPVAFAKPFANPSGSSSSYGGNPLAPAPAPLTLEAIIEKRPVQHSPALGGEMLGGVKRWERGIPLVREAPRQGVPLG